MRRLTMYFLLLSTIGVFSQPVPQTSKITNRYFPDPDIIISTPAFSKKKGFTSYNEMIDFCMKLENSFPQLVSISYIGNSQKGKPIPLIKITNQQSDSNSKIKVFFQAGLHGDEPASTEGMLFLMTKLLTDTTFSKFTSGIELVIIPMANPDGCDILERVSANGIDLNRDQSKLTAPETVLLKKALISFNPSIALDFHEYKPFRKDYAKLGSFGITTSQDVMLMYSGNLNVPAEIRNFTKYKFFGSIENALKLNGLTFSDYFSSSSVNGEIHLNMGSTNARSSATSWALNNIIAGLVEIRGGDLARTSYKRRVNSALIIAKAALDCAFSSRENINGLLKTAHSQPAEELTVKSKSVAEATAIPVIDLETGKIADITLPVSNAWNSTTLLKRTTPEAYILLPNEKTAVEKLSQLGIEVKTLNEPQQFKVENYVIENYEKDKTLYEGVFTQKLNTIINTIDKEFPVGSFLINMNQPRWPLIAELLEPEAPNSFITFSVIDVSDKSEIPVYRLLKK